MKQFIIFLRGRQYSRRLLFHDLFQCLVDEVAVGVVKAHAHRIPVQRRRQPQIDLLALGVRRRRLHQMDRADLAAADFHGLGLQYLEAPLLGVAAAGLARDPNGLVSWFFRAWSWRRA